MNKEYIFSEKEYAALIGISKEALRSRRREGKLKGEYIQKEDKRYFYCRPEKTEKKETKFKRRLQDQGEKKFESYLMDEKTWRAPKDVIEDPVFTSNLQKISPGRTGDIIEYEFMNIALKCGWEAFKNISQNGPIDCILINPISAKAYYVDCKSVKTHNEAISQLIALRQKRGMYNIYIGYIFNGKAAIQYGENLSDKIILDPIKEVLSYHEHLKTGGLQEDYN